MVVASLPAYPLAIPLHDYSQLVPPFHVPPSPSFIAIAIFLFKEHAVFVIDFPVRKNSYLITLCPLLCKSLHNLFDKFRRCRTAVATDGGIIRFEAETLQRLRCFGGIPLKPGVPSLLPLVLGLVKVSRLFKVFETIPFIGCLKKAVVEYQALR